MRFIAIDSETTGLDPNRCQMVELAMIHADIKPDGTGKIACDTEVKHWYIKPRYDKSVYDGEPKALEMNRGTINQILSGSVLSHTEGEVADEIAKWMVTLGYIKEGFVPCGKNVMGFDMRFLRRLPGWGYPAIKHKHRAIDVGTLWLRPQDSWPQELAECKKRAGLVENVSHRAVDDAMDCVNLVYEWHKRGGCTC